MPIKLILSALALLSLLILACGAAPPTTSPTPTETSPTAQLPDVAAIAPTNAPESPTAIPQPTSIPTIIPTSTPNVSLIVDAMSTPSATPAATPTITPVVSIDLAPDQKTIAEGSSFPFAAAAVGSDADITWSSSNTDIAEVSSAGVVSAKTVGEITVTAVLGSASDTTAVTVTHGPVASVQIGSGTGIILVSTLRDEAGHVLSGETVEWSSTDPNVVDVDRQTGELTIKQIGVATVIASSGGVSDQVNVNVNPEQVAAVEVSPLEAFIEESETVQLSAIIQNASGQLLTNRDVSWASDDANVAEVNAQGLVIAKTAGKANITATSEGVSASALVTVKLPPVDYTLIYSESPVRSSPEPLQGAKSFGDMHIFISPNDRVSSVTFFVNDPDGDRRPVKTENAAPYDLMGTLPDGTAQTLDASKNVPRKYTVTARVQQTDGNVVSVSATFEIIPVPVGSVIITPNLATIEVGQTASLTAQILDTLGDSLHNRDVKWASGDPNVADVDDQGVVTGIADGITTISAEVGGVVSAIPVSITLPVLNFTLLFNSVLDPTTELTNPDNFQELNGAESFTDIVFFVDPIENIGSVSYNVDGNDLGEFAAGQGIVPELGASVLIGASPSGLGVGSHSIVAEVTSTDGETHTLGAIFEVVPPPVASVQIHREIIFSDNGVETFDFFTQATISQGEELGVGAVVTDVLGNVVFDRVIDWTSSDINIVDIREPGAFFSANNAFGAELCTIDAVPLEVVLLGVAPGQASVTATVDGVSSSVIIDVLVFPNGNGNGGVGLPAS